MHTDHHVSSTAGQGATTVVASAIAASPRRQRGAGTNPRPRNRVRGHGRAIPRRAGAQRLTGEQLADMVSAAAAGDASAWDELVREFTGLVRSVARWHRLNDADAADTAQATWLLLFQHLDRIKEPARIGAWVATTARRECLRVLRGTPRCVALDDEWEYVESTEAPADSALLAAERDLALRRCLDRLRATDRQLLTLLMADHQPGYAEISVTLAMPVGSIGPTRARALDRLRDELASDGSLALLSA
jgi:RNA polymerase sigma factor (sigma-70 family)